MFSNRLFLPLWLRIHTCRRLAIKLQPHVQLQMQVLSLHFDTSGYLQSTKTQENLQTTVPIPTVKLNTLPSLSETGSLIVKASLDELLNIGSKLEKAEDAVLLLDRLSQLKKEKDFDLEAVLKDPSIKHVMSLLHKNVIHLPVSQVISCFKSLLSVSPSDTFLLESLERQILWSVRKWQIHSIIKLIETLYEHQETQFRSQMFSEAKSIIERRWVEISNPYDIVSLMYIFDKPKDKVVFTRIQERALDLADRMVPSCLYKVLYLSSRQKVRNTPLIRATVYHLNKKGVALEMFQLANLLYACSSLNIYDEELLTATLENIKEKINSVDSPKTVLMVLKSLSMLRWHQHDAVDAILIYLTNHVSDLSVEEKIGVILSLARLNHVGSTTTKLLQKFTSESFQELIESSPILYLDYVWSLCVLLHANQSLVTSVLKEDFSSKVTGESFEDYHRQVAAIKLMNIQTSAQHDLTDYNGPKLPANWLSNVSQTHIHPNRPLSESVIAALVSTAPLDRFTKKDVLTPMGYFVDAEMYVNQSGQPQPYEQTSEKKPENTFRIALKILDFSDMTQKSVHPTGLHVMARRHLQKEGYTVVELPYFELASKGTVVQKVQYIQEKIKKIVNPDTEQETPSS